MNIKKHLLLCATPTKQKCFKGNEGQKTWECLKKTLKKFENDPSTKNVHILRSKADCLRICKNGPILLVWPDGIWYEKVSSEKISTVSYGEEKPAVSGSNENSWSKKRRALVKTF